MADLLIGNVETGTADDEIKQFLIKYGFPPFDHITHLQGDGTRPAVLLSFDDADTETLSRLQPRVQNLFWKNHTINVQVLSGRTE